RPRRRTRRAARGPRARARGAAPDRRRAPRDRATRRPHEAPPRRPDRKDRFEGGRDSSRRKVWSFSPEPLAGDGIHPNVVASSAIDPADPGAHLIMMAPDHVSVMYVAAPTSM